ncbi:anion permease, partial [Candidatus Woesearchaeota archaeon]|nr:anion permease [Candidatus Woesearchaeota archaeon]
MFMLAVGFASAIGGISTIIGANPNAITAAYLRNVADYSFSDWARVGFPVAFLMFIIAYFVISRIYNLGEETISIGMLSELCRKKKLTKLQRRLITIFIPTIILWLFGGELTSFLGLPIDFYRTEIIGLASCILLFSFRVLQWEDVRRIPWEIFLLVGGGLTLGQILIDSGSAAFLAERLFPVISFFPDFIIIFIIVMISMVLGNFVNNSSATIILVPVIINIAPLLGINYALLAMTVAMATAISPLTPMALPGFSIIYGTGHVTRKEMVRTGLAIALICGPVLAGVLYLFSIII